MNNFDQVAVDATIQKTIEALKNNGMNALVVENGQQAKEKVLEMLPKKAEVMTMTSVTLDTIGLTEAINGSGHYDAVKPKLMKMDRKTHHLEMQKLGAAPEYSVGSVHAVTEDGKIVIASNTGSQLPGYVYGSAHVIWVVGTQKIVKNLEDGIKRIYDYVLPQESVRVQKSYGMPHSNVRKLLIINSEGNPMRITIIFVKEKLGY